MRMFKYVVAVIVVVSFAFVGNVQADSKFYLGANVVSSNYGAEDGADLDTGIGFGVKLGWKFKLSQLMKLDIGNDFDYSSLSGNTKISKDIGNGMKMFAKTKFDGYILVDTIDTTVYYSIVPNTGIDLFAKVGLGGYWVSSNPSGSWEVIDANGDVFSQGNNLEVGSGSSGGVAYKLGGGVEWGFSEHWAVDLGVYYIGLKTVGGTETATNTIDIKGGISFIF